MKLRVVFGPVVWEKVSYNYYYYDGNTKLTQVSLHLFTFQYT